MEESPQLTVLDVYTRDMSSGESDQVWDPSDPVQALLNPRARRQLNREQRDRSGQNIKNKKKKNVLPVTDQTQSTTDSPVYQTASGNKDQIRQTDEINQSLGADPTSGLGLPPTITSEGALVSAQQVDRTAIHDLGSKVKRQLRHSET